MEEIIKVGKEDEYEHFQTGIYAHGKLQDLLGHDLVSSNKNLQEGITKVKIGDNDGLTFVWKGALGRKGLITLESDQESCFYALKCYLKKPKFI